MLWVWIVCIWLLLFQCGIEVVDDVECIVFDESGIYCYVGEDCCGCVIVCYFFDGECQQYFVYGDLQQDF